MADIDSLKIHFSPQGLLLLNVVLSIIMFGIALELRRDDFIALVKNRKSAAAGLIAHFIFLLTVETFIFDFKPLKKNLKSWFPQIWLRNLPKK